MGDQFADPSKDAPVRAEEGGCLCGKIRYEFPRDAMISAHHCHCVDCQKSTGSGKATILFVPADQLLIKGEPKRIPWWVRLAVT